MKQNMAVTKYPFDIMRCLENVLWYLENIMKDPRSVVLVKCHAIFHVPRHLKNVTIDYCSVMFGKHRNKSLFCNVSETSLNLSCFTMFEKHHNRSLFHDVSEMSLNQLMFHDVWPYVAVSTSFLWHFGMNVVIGY